MNISKQKSRILNKINELNSLLKGIGTQIEQERLENNKEDNAIHQELINKKEIIDKKIRDLKSSLSIQNIDNHSDLFGTVFEVEINSLKRSLTIVHPIDAEPLSGKISSGSPIAQALINNNEGDFVEVDTPLGVARYKIIKISS